MVEVGRRPKVLLADDHLLFLAGLSQLLERHYDLVGAVTEPAELLATAKRLKPDILLLDISMPGLDGIEAARQLREIVPTTKIIFVTVHDEPAFVAAALQAGASGYVLKSAAPEVLCRAIDDVWQGRKYLCRSLAERADYSKPEDDPLTPRQKEVLWLLATGLTSREIAETLFITPKAVDFHKGRIRAALGLHSTAELTRYAIAKGLTRP